MKPLDLYLVLTGYTATITVAALARLLLRRSTGAVVSAGVAVAVFVGNTMVGGSIDPDRDHLSVVRFLIAERDVSSAAALLMGVAAGYVWLSRTTRLDRPMPTSWWTRIEPMLLAASIGCVVLCGQAFIWKDLWGTTRHAVSVESADFTIERVASLDDDPLRITAGEDGSVYVCYDYFKKHGAWGGAVLRFREDPDSGEMDRKIVVESPVLARCYGLIAKNGELFVSRSGFFPKADAGRATYEPTGAVSRLRDLDGDGYFEYIDDVVTGLPGVRAPDTMQQNNGILFAPDGSLFVTNASAADRTLDEHPWGGTILRYGPGYTGPEVYAEGFRNPWSIVMGPNDDLFVTDSDVDRNPGDEINHVIRGEHYGHPFVIPNEKGVESEGFRDPVLVAERETVFLGMVYATSPNLPPGYRDCLYVTDFRRNRILRLRLEPKGETYAVTEVSHFASVPTPVDMTVTPAGDFYVISRRAKKLFRIRPQSRRAA